MIGETLGSYRVMAKLGEGGMGAVYAGEHVVLGRRVAIKLLLPGLSSNQELVKRFFNEARATATLDHPGLVQVFDFGHTQTGSAYLVMELLGGESMAARLGRLGRLDYASAAGFCRQATSAVAAAHAVGIVHRDLKPDNLFLVRDPDIAIGERVKVLDFGIAKLADLGPDGLSMTRTGAVLGTPAYMSPEQCRGAGEVDHRSDIYSLGCILFEMVCGRPPFIGAGTGEIIGAHIFQARPSPRSFDPAIPPGLEAVICRALEKDPQARQQSMQQLGAELDALAGHAQPSRLPPPVVIGSGPAGSPGAIASWRGAATPLGLAATVPPPSGPGDPPAGPAGYPATVPVGDPAAGRLGPAAGGLAGPGPLPTSTTFGASAGQRTAALAPRRGWLLPTVIGGAIAVAGGAIAVAVATRSTSGPPADVPPKPPAVAQRDSDPRRQPAEPPERLPEPPAPPAEPAPPRLNVPPVEPSSAAPVSRTSPAEAPTGRVAKRPKLPAPRTEPAGKLPGAARVPDPPAAEPPPRRPEPVATVEASNPFLARQVWSGRYVCGQGDTALRLLIQSVRGDDVSAVFEFSHPGSGAIGSYQLAGRYDAMRRRLVLTPVAWIRRPTGYEMVGMAGAVSPDLTTYAGSITNPACSTFTVRL